MTSAIPTCVRIYQVHAAELLTAFECVKDVLLSLKSTLEYIDPALDKDEV